jgi:FkbM family methyltransferase
MKLGHLISLRRYRRCRRLFRSPLRAQLQIAAARRRPLTLELVQGGSLSVPDVRQCRGMFNWLLEGPTDPLPITVEKGLVAFNYQHLRIALRPSSEDFYVLKEIFLDDVYGINTLKGPLGTVVDLGGNVGLFALRVAPIAARVICVEPVAANLQIASQNVRRSGAHHKVTLCKCAVTGESGKTARIFLSAGNTGGHSVRREHAARWEAAGYEDVPSVSLAELFEREGVQRCSLLKCDVEGSEFEIFRSAPPEILARIDRIAMEVHLTGADWNLEKLGALREGLEAAGFRVTHEAVRDRRRRLKPAVMLFASRPDRARVHRSAA